MTVERKRYRAKVVASIVVFGIPAAVGSILTLLFYEGPWYWRLFYAVLVGAGFVMGVSLIVAIPMVVISWVIKYLMEWKRELALLWTVFRQWTKKHRH